MHIKSRLPDLPPIPDANVFDLFFTAPQGTQIPDYTVFIDAATGLKHSFRNYCEFVRDAATALGAVPARGGLGLSGEAGDIVGIFSHNCVSYLALAHALLAITTPFANLSAYATVFELTHALRTAKPKLLFVQPALLPTALAAAKEVGLSETRIYVLEGTASDGRLSLQGLVNRVRKSPIPREPIRPAKKNTLAYLVFSSGTSGLPKAVMASHGNVWAMVLMTVIWRQEEVKFLQLTPPKEPPIALCFLPLYHAYSLNVVGFHMFSIAPLTRVIMDKWNTSAVLKAIPKYRVNLFALVPSVVHQLVNHPEFAKTDFSSVIGAGCGAAHLPKTLRDNFQSRFNNAALTAGYGMSELTYSLARTPPDGLYGLKVPDTSCGLINSGAEVRTVREEGSEADVDEPGELWVKAPTVAPGYYGNENATRETFVNGWLRTGDWMRIDKDGFLHFVERKKDTLKVGGAQVSPSEIEEVLHAQPDGLIIDACVGGVSGGRTSDEKVPRAWIVLSDKGKRRGADETIKVLETWTKENLSPYKRLRGGFEVVDEIPKNPTGKMLRRLLQDRFEAQHAARAKL
ncbi:uncharacterized protein PHACADRAFT_262572 [Phanerochaete carnosa HHB-10118-sp]|uniref:AMP-dependent synthetase/ligase domain-containing protein n=1 Tax=Phanerochaete carnosa (strain HHB-10118-sp) TaxID=650164 RepID=K5VL14_PHACS|nr:uncharacterized protein PHACADRAFT_262572 [Phanerochaete carnosa HHB-10118-sp]EKM52103.1 hypothetical protein PHACADRAFT_262572 [Phanerochaete carnosa HHB-10118-sp]